MTPDELPQIQQSPPGAKSITLALSRCYEKMGVRKAGNNTQQNYKYIKLDHILDAVRDAMTEEGLALIPLSMIVLRNEPRTQFLNNDIKPDKGFRAEVKITYELTLHGCDDRRVIEWIGQADDYQDRALSKAAAFCHKTLLKALFNVSEGDDEDPDGDKTEPRAAASTAPRQQAARNQGSRPAAQAAQPAATKAPAGPPLPSAFGYTPPKWPDEASFTKPATSSQIVKINDYLNDRGFKDWSEDERGKALATLATAFGLSGEKATSNGAMALIVAFFMNAGDDHVSALYKSAGGVE